jgi:hypothetical protein
MNAEMNLTMAEAVALYWKLRHRGHSAVLARLSVEARVGGLSSLQRKELHNLLSGNTEVYEVPGDFIAGGKAGSEPSSADYTMS